MTEHFNFNASSLSTTDTEPSREAATVYAADDGVIGTIRLHDIFHLRYRDTNANGTPDAGEIAPSIERLHVSCP